MLFEIHQKARIGARVIIQMVFSRTQLEWEWLEPPTRAQKIKHNLVRQQRSCKKIQGVCCCEPHACFEAYRRFRATVELYLYCMLMPGSLYQVPPPSLEIIVTDKDVPANLVYRVLKDLNYKKAYIEMLLYTVEFYLELKPDGRIFQLIQDCGGNHTRFVCMSVGQFEDIQDSEEDETFMTEETVLKKLTRYPSSTSVNSYVMQTIFCCLIVTCL